nr:MAG TPA: hypothetical protein [Caudoviricetes sp.]
MRHIRGSTLPFHFILMHQRLNYLRFGGGLQKAVPKKSPGIVQGNHTVKIRRGGAHRHHYVAAGDLAHGKARFDLHKKSPQSHSFTYTILYWGKTFNNLLKTFLQIATFFYSFSLEAQQKNGYNNLGNFDKLLSIVGRSKSS